jgi:hypothetical protein
MQVSLDDDDARALLCLMDGSRDREALVDELHELTSVDRSVAHARLEDYVKRLAELGLLRATIPGAGDSLR